jgi:hypothetical protein
MFILSYKGEHIMKQDDLEYVYVRKGRNDIPTVPGLARQCPYCQVWDRFEILYKEPEGSKEKVNCKCGRTFTITKGRKYK